MANLVAFITARLDEEAEMARGAGEVGDTDWLYRTPWRVKADPDDAALASVLDASRYRPRVIADAVVTEAAEHIARWDPARVLAEVAAKRAILADHRPVRFTDVSLGIRDALVCRVCHAHLDEPDGWPDDREWLYPLVQQAWPCRTARALVAPHADHPDFDPSWAITEEDQ